VRVLLPLDEEVEMLSMGIETAAGLEGEVEEVSIWEGEGGSRETRVAVNILPEHCRLV
jgi:hypothetical protein